MSIFSKLFGKGGDESGQAPEADDPIVIVPIPALVTLLLHHETEKGSPLTEAEVIAIRDGAICMTMPYSAAAKLAEGRGYDDLMLENAWEEWSAIRPTLSPDN